MKSVVVIGSGLAGSLICNELARDCRVTLLEAGPRDRITYPEMAFVNKDFGVVKTFCIGGGGTTNLWHNGLMPLDPGDVDSGPFRDVLNEAGPYLDEAATRLFFKNKNYSAEYDALRSDMIRAVEGASAFTDGVDCLLYPKTYHPLMPDPGVEAVYGVSDIKFIGKGGVK
jgi:choline dehydrogenase-like flavoprotein